MATFTEAPIIARQYLTDGGVPLSGGLLYTLSAGGSWPADAVPTYQTATGTLHSNPIVLDSAGRISGSSELFLQPGQSYKFILRTSAGVLVWTKDGVGAVPPSAVNVDVQGIAGVDVSAGDAVYLSAGLGGLNAGQWYPTDADFSYASEDAVTVGMAPNAISQGDSGTIRTAGEITLTGPLTPGASYYASAIAGAITSTAPTFARFVGQAQSATSLVLPTPNTHASTSVIDINVVQGRLTLTTGVPVTTADVTAATTVYFTPYQGSQIALYDGTAWHLRTFAQLSVPVPATTGSLYDVFVCEVAGVRTLELSAAWNSATTRFAAGPYATLLPTQDGVYVKSTNGTVIDNTRRYVGTFRTTGVSGQTEDSGLSAATPKRYLYNYYNRVERQFRRVETTGNWAYNGVIRQANGAAANQIEIVNGVAEEAITVTVQASGDVTNTANLAVAIGEDSTVTGVGGVAGAGYAVAGQGFYLTATLRKVPAIGYHFYTWLEASGAATTTWYGATVVTAAAPNGLSGMVRQ